MYFTAEPAQARIPLLHSHSVPLQTTSTVSKISNYLKAIAIEYSSPQRFTFKAEHFPRPSTHPIETHEEIPSQENELLSRRRPRRSKAADLSCFIDK